MALPDDPDLDNKGAVQQYRLTPRCHARVKEQADRLGMPMHMLVSSELRRFVTLVRKHVDRAQLFVGGKGPSVKKASRAADEVTVRCPRPVADDVDAIARAMQIPESVLVEDVLLSRIDEIAKRPALNPHNWNGVVSTGILRLINKPYKVNDDE